MISTIQDKLHSGSDHTETANGKMITTKIKQVTDVFLKVFYCFKIIVIGKISDSDLGMMYDIFKKTQAAIIGQRNTVEGST
jgi:hypothetical protein